MEDYYTYNFDDKKGIITFPVYGTPPSVLQRHMTIRQIKEIVKLSKKSKKELIKLNRNLERAYQGKELTKYELIYQIVFLADAPYN